MDKQTWHLCQHDVLKSDCPEHGLRPRIAELEAALSAERVRADDEAHFRAKANGDALAQHERAEEALAALAAERETVALLRGERCDGGAGAVNGCGLCPKCATAQHERAETAEIHLAAERTARETAERDLEALAAHMNRSVNHERERAVRAEREREEQREAKDAAYQRLLPIASELADQHALVGEQAGALADIAFSDDMDEATRRRKAERIYRLAPARASALARLRAEFVAAWDAAYMPGIDYLGNRWLPVLAAREALRRAEEEKP